jgi:N-acetylmuramoyl-L-alanine amidase
MIDPGHGGRDPGAVGIGGLKEKDINMAISQRVAARLEQNGIRAVMTRSDDRELGLSPRVSMAERANANLFVSIHANAISMSRPDVNGFETYYHSMGYGLARSIQDSVLSRVNIRDRGVRRANFYVIRYTSMPAVLVETGFVTGREDAARFRNIAERDRIADAIADGILNYVRRTANR